MSVVSADGQQTRPSDVNAFTKEEGEDAVDSSSESRSCRFVYMVEYGIQCLFFLYVFESLIYTQGGVLYTLSFRY